MTGMPQSRYWSVKSDHPVRLTRSLSIKERRSFVSDGRENLWRSSSTGKEDWRPVRVIRHQHEQFPPLHIISASHGSAAELQKALMRCCSEWFESELEVGEGRIREPILLTLQGRLCEGECVRADVKCLTQENSAHYLPQSLRIRGRAM
jgi:hypothetical protein